AGSPSTSMMGTGNAACCLAPALAVLLAVTCVSAGRLTGWRWVAHPPSGVNAIRRQHNNRPGCIETPSRAGDEDGSAHTAFNGADACDFGCRSSQKPPLRMILRTAVGSSRTSLWQGRIEGELVAS